MKNTLRSGILLGMGLLCAGTFVATTQTASAAPDRTGDNRWQDRRDDNNRGRDGDRRNDRDDDDRRDWRNDRDDNRWNNGNGRGNGRGPHWNNSDRRNDNGWRDNNGRWNDRDWRDNDYRGNWGNNGNYGGWGNNNSRSTIEGVVVQDLSGNDFVIRTNSGRQIRVVARNGESRRISRGDIVRAYGTSYNGTFNAQNVTILRNR